MKIIPRSHQQDLRGCREWLVEIDGHVTLGRIWYWRDADACVFAPHSQTLSSTELRKLADILDEKTAEVNKEGA